MTIILCVDDHLGMAFHQRRQSQDRVVRQHILTDTAGARLWISPYSARQFAPEEQCHLTVAEDFLSQAGAEDFCFVEDRPLLPWADRITAVYLYHWNRRYPADLRLDLPLDGPPWTLARREEFPGHSHDTITKEVYTR